MSSPYDTITETNAVNDELRKRVMALSEENEALENKCVTARFIWIAAVAVAIISALLNVALYNDNDRLNSTYKSEVAKYHDAEQRVQNCIEFIHIQNQEIDTLKERVKYEKQWRSELNRKYPNQLPLPKLVMKG